MACLAGVQNWLCGTGKSAQPKGAEEDTAGKNVSWSQAKSAASKVRLDVVWEVPPQTDGNFPPRPDFAIAKYAKIKPLNAALLDSYVDGFQRTTTLFFGRIVSNPDDVPAFEEPLGYNMTYNAMASGNGNALHRHNSVEIFVALDAPFEIAYGSKGQYKAMLMPWDVVACPAEAIHSYKNIGEDGGQILTFLCGKPSITWAAGVVEQARKKGAICDDTGILLSGAATAKKTPVADIWGPDGWTTPSRQSTADEEWTSQAEDSEVDWREFNGASWASNYTVATDSDLAESLKRNSSDSDVAESLKRRAALQGIQADELILKRGALDKFVYRYKDRATRSLEVSSSVGTMRITWVDLAPCRAFTPEGEEDTLVVVLGGSVVCNNWHYMHLDVLRQPNFITAGTQGATLLVTRSVLPHNLNFFFDADIMAAST